MDIFDFDTSDAQDALAQAGFRDVERALHNLEELAELEADGHLSDNFSSALIDAPDPDMALHNFVRIVQATSTACLFCTRSKRIPSCAACCCAFWVVALLWPI